MDATINDLISGLNHLGRAFSSHALSMLWQSAILIGLLFLVDLLLRRHVKAVWRYCLWMLLFVKLVLPPSFALPTGALYWLADHRISSPSISQPTVETVAYMPVEMPIHIPQDRTIAPLPAEGEQPAAPLSVSTDLPPIQGAHTSLCPQAAFFLFWISGVFTLSLYLARRVWLVRGLVTSAKLADGRILELLESCRAAVGLRSTADLKISSEVVSPSVCGFIRPTILLPAQIARELSPQKLKPILIHELAHVKRGDILVNLIQTILQIVYFYNPLLWMANAIVRRLREEAVDEAVLVCLGGGADNYSMTLIDVAEMARRQPSLGLRLIGVVESQSALRQRIKRMATRNIPRSARIGPAGLAFLAIAAATLLPMARAQDGDILKVAADGTEQYKSIQAAIDSASSGATIRVSPGRYEERLKISKPLTLEGAGWDKTTVTMPNRVVEIAQELMQKAMQRIQAASTDDERKAIEAEFKAKYNSQFAGELSPAVLSITNTKDVTIRNIKFTHPGTVMEGSSISVPAINCSDAGAAFADCVVLDSPGDGIHIVDGSHVEVRNCLVAAVWSTGIAVAKGNAASSVAKIIDSEIRNCHHRCITFGPGTDKSLVKGCRISGSAWHGVRYDNTSPTITGNLIFGNARFGIYASGTTGASVKNNVFYANQMAGMGCWFRNGDKIEGNTFIDNDRSGLEILGASAPAVRRNIFSANPAGIGLGDIGSDSPDARSDGVITLEHNIFWNNGDNVTQRRTKIDNGDSTTESVPLDEGHGNVETDPLYVDLLRKDFSLKADSPARRERIGVADPLSPAGPWPIQPEEIAIIPDGDTRDSRKWKTPAPKPTTAKESTETEAVKPAPVAVRELQEAIDAAQPGGTVIVPEGTQTEPVTISKSLTLKGASRTGSVFEVTANQPAILIDTKGKDKVIIENLTIKWQLATSDKCDTPYAAAVKDSAAEFTDCTFSPLGNFQRCPVALYSMGFSRLDIKGCDFDGYEYTVSFGEGTEGSIRNSLVADSGHQCVSLYSGATVEIADNVITGSLFHGIRNTGGTANIKGNLIINNANRGIYLGNRSAAGTVTNNVIIGNSTGISGFGRTRVEIRNNVIADSNYAAVSMRDSCSLTIADNIIKGNQRGLIVHEEGVTGANKIESNTFWQNKADTENCDLPAESVAADPVFADCANGDFSLQPGPSMTKKHGLTDAKALTTLWDIWKKSALTE